VCDVINPTKRRVLCTKIRKVNVKRITCRANGLYTSAFLCRSSASMICHDVAVIGTSSSTTRRRCTKTRKLNVKMPTSHTKVFFTSAFLRRQRGRYDCYVVSTLTLTWRRRHAVEDMSPSCQKGGTSRKRRVCPQKLGVSVLLSDITFIIFAVFDA